MTEYHKDDNIVVKGKFIGEIIDICSFVERAVGDFGANLRAINKAIGELYMRTNYVTYINLVIVAAIIEILPSVYIVQIIMVFHCGVYHIRVLKRFPVPGEKLFVVYGTCLFMPIHCICRTPV